MNENLNDILGKLAEFLKSEAKTETVIGREFQLGEFKCIPVMGVGMGFGGGGGQGDDPKRGKGAGMGAGAGMGMAPVGFLATRGDAIQFIPARRASGLGAAFEKLPSLLEKYLDKSRQGKTEKGV